MGDWGFGSVDLGVVEGRVGCNINQVQTRLRDQIEMGGWGFGSVDSGVVEGRLDARST